MRGEGVSSLGFHEMEPRPKRTCGNSAEAGVLQDCNMSRAPTGPTSVFVSHPLLIWT